jgi:hypothetical protein
MKTNNLEHNLKVGSLVWSLTSTWKQVYRIKKITEKRIVCQEVGAYRDNGIVLHGLNLARSNHVPENLFEVEKHVRAYVLAVNQLEN